MNHINNQNRNEMVFTIPFNQNIDIFHTIEQMLNQVNINNNNEYIELDIQFDFLGNNIQNIVNNNHNYFHIHNYFENNNYDNIDSHKIDHFHYCYEIDEKINKSEKIKKDDTVLKEQCFICMDEYKVNQFKRVLPKCNHYFHKKCIDKWLKKKASCPICRDDLLK
jgi:hypothetical protein